MFNDGCMIAAVNKYNKFVVEYVCTPVTCLLQVFVYIPTIVANLDRLSILMVSSLVRDGPCRSQRCQSR